MRYVRTETSPGLFGETNLRLVLLPEAKEDILELARRVNDPEDETSTSDAEAEVLEDLIANGFTYVQPEDVGALTSAPMISQDFECDEETGETRPVVGSMVYAYMAYETRSFVDDLAERGEAFFRGARVTEARGSHDEERRTNP